MGFLGIFGILASRVSQIGFETVHGVSDRREIWRPRRRLNASTEAIRQHRTIRSSIPQTVDPERKGLKTLQPISRKATPPEERKTGKNTTLTPQTNPPPVPRTYSSRTRKTHQPSKPSNPRSCKPYTRREPSPLPST